MAYQFELGVVDLTVEKTLAGVTSPAASATVNVYRKSLLVTAGPVTINGGGASNVVPVYSIHPIAVGDTVFKNTDTAALLTVTAIASTLVTLQNNTGAAITLNALDRLVPANRRPTAYADERGTLAIGSTANPTNSNGRSVFYILERSVDVIVSGGGLSAPQHIAELGAVGGGFVIDPFDWGIKLDGATNDGPRWQSMLDAIAADTFPAIIECPPGTSLSPIEVVCNASNVVIRGAGGRATNFFSTHATDPFFRFVGTDCVFERASLNKFLTLTGLALDIKGTAARTILRDIVLQNSGAGIRVAARDCLIDNAVAVGSGHSRILLATQDGGNVALNLQVRGLRGSHDAPAGQMTSAIVCERGATHVTFTDLGLTPTTPATQGGTVLTVQDGGGAPPEDIVVNGGRSSGGHGASGIAVLGGIVRVNGFSAVDCGVGFLVSNMIEAVFNGSYSIGSRQHGWSVSGTLGIVRINDSGSSDASQAAANTSDHLSIASGRPYIYIDGFSMGNSMRGSGTWARDGIRYGGGAITYGSRRRVSWAPHSSEIGITGELVNLNGTTFADTYDSSHNEGAPDVAMSTTPNNTPEHVASARKTKTITAGTTLTINHCETLILNHGAPTSFTTVNGQAEGQIVDVYNISASAMTIPHTGGVIENIGAAAVVLATREKVQYRFVGGILRQWAAKHAAS